MDCESALQSMVDKLGAIVTLLQEIKALSAKNEQMANDINAIKNIIVGGS